MSVPNIAGPISGDKARETIAEGSSAREAYSEDVNEHEGSLTTSRVSSENSVVSLEDTEFWVREPSIVDV